MREIGGRELESRLQEHYRTMPVDSSRDLTARVAEAIDRAPNRHRTSFLLRSAVGLAAAAAILLVGGIIFASMVGAPSGGQGVSSAGATTTCTGTGPGPAPSSTGSAAGSGASGNPCAAETGVTKAQAIAAVEAFIGRKLVSPDVSGPQASASGSSYQVMEAGVSAWVDAATGRVTSLMTVPVPETTTMALSPAQAQTAAAAFLNAHSIPFDGLTPAVTVEDHGCCKFYVVTWQRYVNGITVPDTRIVKLDPSNGAVFSFTDTREQVGPVASPRIDRVEAIRLAAIASGFANPIVGDVQLIVDGGPTFRGRLVWSIKLDDGAGASVSHAWIYVDAITGEAKVVGRG
jgi:hypothetical protein